MIDRVLRNDVVGDDDGDASVQLCLLCTVVCRWARCRHVPACAGCMQVQCMHHTHSAGNHLTSTCIVWAVHGLLAYSFDLMNTYVQINRTDG